MLLAHYEVRTTLSNFRARFEEGWNELDNKFFDYGYSLSYSITMASDGNGLVIDFGIFLVLRFSVVGHQT
jgi:hypothetical protein